MQAPPVELFETIARYAAQPTIFLGILYGYEKLMGRKRNGSHKELLQHLDLTITQHFEQLRRDLETKIDKSTENAIMRYLWEVERRRQDRA